MKIVEGAFGLYIWAGLTILMFFLYRIARFYQITSGRRTRYRLFLVPLVLLLLAALLNLSVDPALEVGRDVLLLAGGISLIGLSYYLLQLMTGSRP